MTIEETTTDTTPTGTPATWRDYTWRTFVETAHVPLGSDPFGPRAVACDWPYLAALAARQACFSSATCDAYSVDGPADAPDAPPTLLWRAYIRADLYDALSRIAPAERVDRVDALLAAIDAGTIDGAAYATVGPDEGDATFCGCAYGHLFYGAHTCDGERIALSDAALGNGNYREHDALGARIGELGRGATPEIMHAVEMAIAEVRPGDLPSDTPILASLRDVLVGIREELMAAGYRPAHDQA